MRRKDREVKDPEEIRGILNRADVLRISLNNGMYPYIVPVNFGFTMDGDQLVLFFHSSKDGIKHEIITRDNHAAFEVDCGHMLIPPTGDKSCTASFAYESVIGQGIIEKADESEKENLLAQLLAHYGIKAEKFDPKYLAVTAVYKINAVNYTAKHRIDDRVR